MFELSWHVDTAGYEWIEQHIGRTILTGRRVWTLQRRGGQLRTYNPFDYPSLARHFARLALGREAVLEFTNEWGALDEAAGLRFDEISARRRALALIFSALDYESPKDALASGPRMAAVMFGEKLPPPLLDLRLTQPEDQPAIAEDRKAPARPQMIFAPQSLWGALLVLTAIEINGLVTATTCLHCRILLPIGPEKATRRRKFCNARCRGAWHRDHPKETP